MAALTTARRKALPKKEFALPASRAYPVDTRARAANAKARATQAVNAGRMSESTAAKIRAKANAKLDRTAPKRPVPNNLRQMMKG